MWQYTNSNELYHYGILGMKWGVRRYQNPDGSLTSAGKKRYGDNLDVSIAKNSQTRRVANDYNKLSDSEFKRKYAGSKEAFAKRYKKTNGDTYSLGLKKQERAKKILNAFPNKQAESQAKSQAKVQAFIDKKRASLQKSIDQYIADDPKCVKKGYNWLVDDLRSADKKLSELDASKATMKQVKHIYKYG